jgi:hypothetical protein
MVKNPSGIKVRRAPLVPLVPGARLSSSPLHSSPLLSPHSLVTHCSLHAPLAPLSPLALGALFHTHHAPLSLPSLLEPSDCLTPLHRRRLNNHQVIKAFRVAHSIISPLVLNNCLSLFGFIYKNTSCCRPSHNPNRLTSTRTHHLSLQHQNSYTSTAIDNKVPPHYHHPTAPSYHNHKIKINHDSLGIELRNAIVLVIGSSLSVTPSGSVGGFLSTHSRSAVSFCALRAAVRASASSAAAPPSACLLAV